MTTAEQLREQGQEQGRRDVLLRLIHLRFGDLAAEHLLRVGSADRKRLDALTEQEPQGGSIP